MWSLIQRVPMLLRRRRAGRELDEELQFHLEMSRGAFEHEGLSPDDAHHAARRRLGGSPLRVREQAAEVWSWRPLDALTQDARYAARVLRRRSAGSLAQALAAAGMRATRDRRAMRLLGTLIVAEIALSAMLLTGMMLMLESFLRIRQVDPGLDPRQGLDGRAPAVVRLSRAAADRRVLRADARPRPRTAARDRRRDRRVPAVQWPMWPRDRAAGYDQRLAICQREVSVTHVFDRPVQGRHFFEAVIRENLDLGRPDRVALLFPLRLTRAPRPTVRLSDPGEHGRCSSPVCTSSTSPRM